MREIIEGNLFTIGAMVCDSVAGSRRTRRQILLVQCLSQVFYIVSSLILKGCSAAVQNAVAILRNLFAAFSIKNKVLEYALIASPVVLGIIFNNRGLPGLLPIAANLEYSVAMFAFPEDPRMLKYALIINCTMFSVFNFVILNFVGGVGAICIVIFTALSLLRKNQSRAPAGEIPAQEFHNAAEKEMTP